MTLSLFSSSGLLRSFVLLIGMLFTLLLVACSVSNNPSASAATPTESSIVLVQDGQSNAVIIVQADAPAYTRRAAEELRDYIEAISGARLPLIHDPEQATAATRIWVGIHPALSALHPDLDLAFNHPEEILLQTAGTDLIIAGNDLVAGDQQVQAGSYLATTTFLQHNLGVRWLWPGELGTDLIEQETISIEPFHYRYHPQLRHRILRSVNYARQLARIDSLPSTFPGIEDPLQWAQERDTEVRQWLHRQRVDHNASGQPRSAIRGSLPFSAGHAFTHWYDRFAKTHPEWFALQPDGLRASEQDEPFPSRKNAKLCISNPAVAEQWLADAAERIHESPQGVLVISASPNDNGYMGYCVCDDCAAMDSPDAPMLESPLVWRDQKVEHRALTDRYVRFWNTLAQGLKEQFPDREVYIGVWAYHANRPAPTAVELDERILVGYVGIRRRNPFENSEANMAKQREIWQQWAEKASSIIWRPNLINRSMGMPYLFLDSHAKNMRFLAENRMRGIDVDSFNNNWATQGPQYYLTAQLTWDPYADAEAIISDYYQRAYGPAAEAIAAYYDVFEQHYKWLAENVAQWHLRTGVIPAFRNTSGWLDSLGDTLPEQRAEEWLRLAEAQVADGPDKYRRRVAFVRTGFDYMVAHLDAIEATLASRQDGANVEQHLAAAKAAAQRRETIMAASESPFAVNYLYILGHLQSFPDDFGANASIGASQQ